MTELIEAAKNGKTETVELLLNHGADVHTRNNYALRWAVKYRKTQTVNLLLQHKADPSAENYQALKIAATKNHSETFHLLLNNSKPPLTTLEPIYNSAPEQIQQLITAHYKQSKKKSARSAI